MNRRPTLGCSRRGPLRYCLPPYSVIASRSTRLNPRPLGDGMSRILLAICVLSVFITLGCDRPVPTPVIPITSQVSWWAHQDKLTVDRLAVARINQDKHLNVLNSEFDLSFELSGLVRGQPGWRPYIREVHIAEIRVNPHSNPSHRCKIVVTPVADVTEDSGYTEAPVRWNVRFTRHKQTMGWGANFYEIESGQRRQVIEVVQRK